MTIQFSSIDQALREAETLARQGATGEARALFNSVLEQQPDNKRAIRGLQSIAAPQAQPRHGAPLTRQQANALVSLYQLGRFDEALAQGLTLAAQHPSVAFLHNINGACHAALGKPEDAVTCYRKALALKPDAADVRNNLGDALNRLGRHGEAAEQLRRALELRPGYPEALLNLGNALADLGHRDDAAKMLEKAVLARPGYAQAHNDLGIVLGTLGRDDEAMAQFREAIRLNPTYAQAHYNLGIVLAKTGRTDDAITAYREAIRLNPGHAEAHNNLGSALSDAGAFEEAQSSFRNAIELAPGHAEAHANLANITRFSEGDPLIGQMRALLSNSANPQERMYLNFALGKAFDEIGAADAAFTHLAEANLIRKTAGRYDIEKDRNQFERIRMLFDDLSDRPGIRQPGNPGIRPVFIIGMPRSGTSLVEQILASHHGVHGAGELPFLHETMAPIADAAAGPLAGDELHRIRDGYLAKLRELGAAEPVIVDKMPFNFRWTGFIAAALPEAAIIHVRRDAVAVGWSIYKTYFPARGLDFGFSLGDIGAYYRLYGELMAFWSERLPGRIHHIDYDRLTEDQEEETRRLLAHCGLDWDAACLDFHETERAVRTASSAQVREKMYSGSSQAWRKYEKHLGPLIEALA